jgi:ABC-type glycerol-3-phosphate transport system substrate-binding protein
MGYTGQISIGHAALYGLGAYSSALLALRAMGKLMNRTPARLSVYNAPPWNDPKFAIFAKALQDARSLPGVGDWFSIQTVIITEAQGILVGQMTPQQAADSMAKQIDAILARQ